MTLSDHPRLNSIDQRAEVKVERLEVMTLSDHLRLKSIDQRAEVKVERLEVMTQSPAAFTLKKYLMKSKKQT